VCSKIAATARAAHRTPPITAMCIGTAVVLSVEIAGSGCSEASAAALPACGIEDIDTVDTLPDYPGVTEIESGVSTTASEWDTAEARDIEQRMEDAAHVSEWNSKDWDILETLQEAPRNQGRVLLARSLRHGGTFAAVKQMPNEWVAASHTEFVREHPDSTERPWFDVGIVHYLNDCGFEHVLRPLGVFKDTLNTYVVSAYATEGDMFSWVPRERPQGDSEHTNLRPLMQQLFGAVRQLHDFGISHNDLSLENILVTREDPSDAPSIKLIDFGMASLAQHNRGCSGKRSYVAPEQHADELHDSRLSDAFAVGVCLFTLAARSYPWDSTRPGCCRQFDFIAAHGLRAYIARKRVRRSSDVRLGEVLSPSLVDVVEGLLALRPEARACLGERCFADDVASGVRRSATSMPWLNA